MNKLPKVNTYFWIMKLAATTLGETGGDLLSMTLALDYARSGVVFFGLFLVSLFAQLKSKTYRPVIFWSVILTTTLTGTAVGDFLADSSGLGFTGANILITGVLALVLIATLFTNVPRVPLFWIAF